MRRAAAGAALGAAVAIGVPVTGQLGQAPASVGAPVAQVLAASTPSAVPGQLPSVVLAGHVDDAEQGLGAVPRSRVVVVAEPAP